VTDAPAPGVIYRRGSHDTVLAGNKEDVLEGGIRIPPLDTANVETAVTKKAAEIARELDGQESARENAARRLKSLQDKADEQAAAYYAMVAAINAHLQAGTTPGNPVLVERWGTAQDKLNTMSDATSLLSTLATDLTNQASKSSFLLESIRSAFNISGAVDEDHKRLTSLEDLTNNNIITLQRLITETNDEIARRAASMRTERANLQSLSLSIANGELYGESLGNSVYKKAAEGNTKVTAVPASKRPLVVIRFDHANVNYDQPLYKAVNQALEKYPAAKFDLVAVSSTEGNPAEVSMAAAEARKNGKAVLRSLTQMGLPIERVNLNAATSKEVLNSEVRIYIR
jgi:hypothetical protein